MAQARAKPTKVQTKPTSIVTFLLDRTGSMGSWKAATIEGFNGYLDSLKEETGADIRFTFLQFDSVSVDYVCVEVPVKDVASLTNETYQPRASTPLIDAAVKTIRAVEWSLAKRSDKPKVVVCIQTDGEENASREFKWEDLHGLVTMKRAEGWEFNFMGAGIDAYQQAQRMGVMAESTTSYDSRNIGSTRAAFAASASNARGFVSGQSVNTQYSNAQRAASGDTFAARHGVGGPITPVVQPKQPAHTTVVPNIKL